MNPEIRSKLDRICNILWSGGLSVPALFIEQISYLIYLKLLDERETELELKGRLLKGKGGNEKLLFPDQASRYRWSNWRFKSGNDLRDFLGDEVFPYMASLLKEEPQVAIYFQDAKLEIDDAHVLKEVIDGLDSFHFTKLGPGVAVLHINQGFRGRAFHNQERLCSKNTRQSDRLGIPRMGCREQDKRPYNLCRQHRAAS